MLINKKSLYSFLVCLLFCFVAALPSIWFKPDVWFATLQKPDWMPPSAVFGPVWTLLYFMMGISLWRVWSKVKWSQPTKVFVVQWFFNLAWTCLFFGLHQPFWAVIDLGALWFALSLTVWLFHRVDSRSAILLLPYWVWVSFAACLNLAIVHLNP